MSQPNFPNPNSPNPNYPNQGQPNQGHPSQGYPNQAPNQGYPPQPYPQQAYPAQPYPTQPYPAQPYPAQPYPAQPYSAQPYPAQAYPAQGYPNQGNANPGININTNPTGSPILGSATHAYRKRNFKAALSTSRGILIAAGLMAFVVSAIDYYQISSQMKDIDAAYELLAPEMKAKIDNAVSTVYVIVGTHFALGILFLASAFLLHLAPAPICIACLALYAGFHSVLAIFYPETIFAGWLFKAAFIGGLVYAIRATTAYQNDLRKANAEQARAGAPLR